MIKGGGALFIWVCYYVNFSKKSRPKAESISDAGYFHGCALQSDISDTSGVNRDKTLMRRFM